MTIGVILAAGVGSRLRPMTNAKPKCLITSANKPILQYQLDSYRSAGVRSVVIVVGYEGISVREYCKYIKDLDITIVENPIYEESNNMYSLYLAKAHVAGKPFVLNNADLTVMPELVPKLVNDPRPDLVAVDVGRYMEESMKVTVDHAGIISNIAKDVPPEVALGCSIDFYKFSSQSSAIFFNEISRIVEDDKNIKDWTEVALQRLFQSNELSFNALDINGMPWVEIDDYVDLALSDKIFSQQRKKILDYKHFIIDLDGTLFIGNKPIPGADSTIRKLRGLGKGISFLSNNSSKSKHDYVEDLAGQGIPSSVDEIVLSTDAVLAYLESNQVKRVYVLGTEALASSIRRKGYEISTENPEFVVVGYDTELTYNKLEVTSRLLNSGVDYIGTHCDLVCPTPDGPIPDIGLLLSMLEETTGRAPYKVFGKPGTETVENICASNNVLMSDVLVVGDRLYTDIKMAIDAHVDSLLVLSGDTDREDVEDSETQPTYILDSLAEV